MNIHIPDVLHRTPRLCKLIGGMPDDEADASPQALPDSNTLAEGIKLFVNRLEYMSSPKGVHTASKTGEIVFNYLFAECEDTLASLLRTVGEEDREEIAGRLCELAGFADNADQFSERSKKNTIASVVEKAAQRGYAAAFEVHLPFFQNVSSYIQGRASMNHQAGKVLNHADKGANGPRKRGKWISKAVGIISAELIRVVDDERYCRRLTFEIIGDECGVSHSTVSRCIQNKRSMELCQIWNAYKEAYSRRTSPTEPHKHYEDL